MKVIEGHQFQYQWKLARNFLCVNNSKLNLPPIQHHFQNIADYWSNFHSGQGVYL